jgi:RNA polymerase sigma factor (sigma-70 family)
MLQQVLQGDQQEWKRFFFAFQPHIARCVSKVLRRNNVPFGKDDVEDFVSEVWANLVRDDLCSLRRFDEGRGHTLASWIKLIATRATIDQLRSRANMQRSRELSTDFDISSDEDDSPDVQMERTERAILARRAISQLRSCDRQFLDLDLREAEPADLAHRLGISVKSVHSRQSKIREKLRRLIRVQQQRVELRAATKSTTVQISRSSDTRPAREAVHGGA